MATDRVHAFALLMILALLHGRERTQVPDTVPRLHASRLPQRSNWWPQSVLTATHMRKSRHDLSLAVSDQFTRQKLRDEHKKFSLSDDFGRSWRSFGGLV